MWNHSYSQVSYRELKILSIFQKSPPARQYFPFTAIEWNPFELRKMEVSLSFLESKLSWLTNSARKGLLYQLFETFKNWPNASDYVWS